MSSDGSDFLKSMSIATSGLRAQAGRMRVISENIANADSTALTAGGEPYRRKTVTFEKPLFPGYVFLRAPRELRGKILQSDYVANLLEVPDEAEFERLGVSIADWARANRFSPALVYQILAGRKRCV